MSQFYDIDSSRVSHREYWWGTKSPLVIFGWLVKWLHVRIPSSSDDPNVDSTLPFVTEALPPPIATSFQPLTTELAALGFRDPVYHIIYDPGTRTTIYWATFRHASGHHFARIHHRTWQQTPTANRGLFPMFFTAFSDGTFLVSSAGKPDMAAPDSVQMNRMHGASAPKLWATHERLAHSLSERKNVSPVMAREDLLSTSERHHQLMRDFHLARGVFRPRSTAEQAKADSFAATVAQAQASGQEHAEVLAELDRLQEQKPGWRTAAWVLAGTLVVFIAAGAAKWDWKFTLLIIPVLLFHEAGHWVAMRLFHYRNVRMFFIPLFGAAVTGQNWNVAGWKKALVSLAGPVPGIAVGVILGIAALVLKQPWLNKAAVLLLLVNGLNLLPILPLDGGHVLQDTLFCRNRWLDGAFRILAIVGLILLGIFGGFKLLPYVAIPMAIALPVVFRLGRITDELRREALPPPLPGEDRIPTSTAQAIIKAVKGAFPAKMGLSNKAVAQHAVTVFERLNAKPPGVLATLSLLVLHSGAFLCAVVVGVLLIIGEHGGLGDFMAASVRQPQHSFQPGDVQSWPRLPHGDEKGARNLVATTLKNRAAALAAFVELTNQVASLTFLVRLADSLIVWIPVADDASRERWFEALQARSTNTFVALSNSPVGVSMTFLAPTKIAATNLTQELKDYFSAGGSMHLIAPWSPQGRRPDFADWRRARQDWTTIAHEVAKVWRDPSLKSYPARISAAMTRGALTEAERLTKEQTEKGQELQEQARERLRAGSPSRIDPGLLDLYARFHSPGLTNNADVKALLREVAAKLGQVAYAGDEPAPGADAYDVTSGLVMRHGLLIEIRWLNFRDVIQGLPAMADWLANLGCRQIKYDLEGRGWIADLEE